jgi:hypothetical protein
MATKKPSLRPPLVLVQWEDATELDAGPWTHEITHEYKPDEAVMQSVGFLLHESKHGVVLTAAWSDGGVLGRRDQIPRGMIRKIVRLRG